MSPKSVFLFALVALAQLATATPPACLLTAVGVTANPADVTSICNDKTMPKTISSACSGDATAAMKAFADTCKSAGVTVSSEVSSASSSASATKSASKTGSMTTSVTGTASKTADASATTSGTASDTGSSGSGSATESASGSTSTPAGTSAGDAIQCSSFAAVAAAAVAIIMVS